MSFCAFDGLGDGSISANVVFEFDGDGRGELSGGVGDGYGGNLRDVFGGGAFGCGVNGVGSMCLRK